MALEIELWVDGRIVTGVAGWWENVELAMRQGSVAGEFPMLSSMDSYMWTLIPASDLGQLASECRALASRAGTKTATYLIKIAELSERATEPGNALLFNGD